MGAKAIGSPSILTGQSRRRQATSAVVVARIERGRHLVGVAREGIHRAVRRVLDVDGDVVDRRIGSHPVESDITFGHGNQLADRRRAGHGDFLHNRAKAVLHLDLATIPTLEVGGLAYDLPCTSRTILIPDFSGTALCTVGHEVDTIGVAIKILNFIFKGHNLTRSHIGLAEDLLVVA